LSIVRLLYLFLSGDVVLILNDTMAGDSFILPPRGGEKDGGEFIGGER
jgi:hypothetical protein